MQPVAYLILAHERPLQLARLIRALDCDDAFFFVHIDRKTGGARFRKAVPPGERVIYLEGPDRVEVHWSGYSTVVATLNLMKAAVSARQNFGRYALLSGADFPIKNRQALREQLGSATEFLRVDQRIDPRKDNLFARRVKYAHLYDHPWFNPRSTPSRRLFSATQRPLRFIPRVGYPEIPLYQGSAWWALTRDCVEYILNFVHEHPEYEAFHRYTCTPDEIFFSLDRGGIYVSKAIESRLRDGRCQPAQGSRLGRLWESLYRLGDAGHRSAEGAGSGRSGADQEVGSPLRPKVQVAGFRCDPG